MSKRDALWWAVVAFLAGLNIGWRTPDNPEVAVLGIILSAWVMWVAVRGMRAARRRKGGGAP